MKLKTIIAGVSAFVLAAMPSIAQAAAASPAASLSVAKSVRAGTPTARTSKLGAGAGGIAAAVILAGIAAIGVITIVNDSEDDSDSD